MRLARHIVAVVVALLSFGCDTVYYERISLLPTPHANDVSGRLEETERQRALAVIDAQASAMGLDCRTTQLPVILDSYDAKEFAFRECTAADEPRVQVLFAVGDSKVVVELHEIGGWRPSLYYTRLSESFHGSLEDTFGADRITVEHPYEQ